MSGNDDKTRHCYQIICTDTVVIVVAEYIPGRAGQLAVSGDKIIYRGIPDARNLLGVGGNSRTILTHINP